MSKFTLNTMWQSASTKSSSTPRFRGKTTLLCECGSHRQRLMRVFGDCYSHIWPLVTPRPLLLQNHISLMWVFTVEFEFLNFKELFLHSDSTDKLQLNNKVDIIMNYILHSYSILLCLFVCMSVCKCFGISASLSVCRPVSLLSYLLLCRIVICRCFMDSLTLFFKSIHILWYLWSRQYIIIISLFLCVWNGLNEYGNSTGIGFLNYIWTRQDSHSIQDMLIMINMKCNMKDKCRKG